MYDEDKCFKSIYNRRDIDIVKGLGSTVWDCDGKEYLDLMTGHGVALFGHSHPKIVAAIKEQAEKVITIPLDFYNEERAKFTQKLASITPGNLNKSFMTNSGTESNECAFKLARKYSGKTDFVAMKRGFHGRSLGSISATWNPKYRKPFEPLVPGFSFVKHSDLDELQDAITDKTAGVIFECVQGEGGIRVPPKDYAKGVRDICTDKKVLMMVDEVQTYARTGNFFSSETYGVVPDIITVAKGLAGGVPIGACVSTEEIFDAFKPGDHGTTFGGNALASAVGLAAINTLEEENLIQKGAEIGEYLQQKLKPAEGFDMVREVRGVGAMVAVECKFPVTNAIKKCQENGIIVFTAGKNVLRALPPLVLQKEEADKAADVILDAIKSSVKQ